MFLYINDICSYHICYLVNVGENSALKQGVLQFLIDPAGHPLPLVAVEDIGEFAAMVLHRPTRYQIIYSDAVTKTPHFGLQNTSFLIHSPSNITPSSTDNTFFIHTYSLASLARKSS